MKKCEEFKDLILTDYIDGELDGALTRKMEDHLLECSDCRAFLKEVKSLTATPLHQAPLQTVPGAVWDSIKEEIQREDQKVSPFEELIERIRGWIVYPKLVPVFASLVLMFLVGSVSLNTMHVRQARAQDQGEYLISLLEPTDVTTTADNNDGSTLIEHYFL